MSDEQKQLISEKKKGQKPWNVGVPMSEKAKAKLSAAKKGQVPWNKGLTLSEEHKRAIRETKARLNARRIDSSLQEE